MEITCQYCGKKFKNLIGLHTHLTKAHNITSKVDHILYNIKYNGLNYPVCPICGQHVKINSRGDFLKTCGNRKCISQLYVQKIKSYYLTHPEAIEKHRNDRISYLSNNLNFEKTAWGKRANGKLSYLEKWFVDNIIIPNKLGDTFDIINEYPIGKYSLDFAFTNAKIDFELDGKCHFSNGDERVAHDYERDEYMMSLGWKVYRISYNDIKNNKNLVEDVISFINSIDKEIDQKIYKSSFYYNHADLQKQVVKNNKRFKNIEENHEKCKKFMILLEKESGIDFTKFGWSSKAIKYLNSIGYTTHKNGVIPLLKRYYPEFFINNNIYLRSSALPISINEKSI